MIDTPWLKSQTNALWFISKHLHWYNNGITWWLMRDLTCVQSTRVCHLVKLQAEPMILLPLLCPQATPWNAYLRSSREVKGALFSYATWPSQSPAGHDGKGSPGFCCCSFSPPTNNCYGNITAAQLFLLPIYSKTQNQTVTAPNTYIFKPLKLLMRKSR